MSGVSPGRRLSAPRYVDVLSHGSCWRLGLVARRRRIQLHTGSIKGRRESAGSGRARDHGAPARCATSCARAGRASTSVCGPDTAVQLYTVRLPRRESSG